MLETIYPKIHLKEPLEIQKQPNYVFNSFINLRMEKPFSFVIKKKGVLFHSVIFLQAVVRDSSAALKLCCGFWNPAMQ